MLEIWEVGGWREKRGRERRRGDGGDEEEGVYLKRLIPDGLEAKRPDVGLVHGEKGGGLVVEVVVDALKEVAEGGFLLQVGEEICER